MNSLLLKGVLHIDVNFIYKLLNIHWVYYVCIMLFYFFSSVLLMKMVVGQIVGIINNVAKAQEDVRHKQESHERIRSVMLKLVPDHDEIITAQEFRTLIHDADFIRGMRDVDIDIIGLVVFFDH